MIITEPNLSMLNLISENIPNNYQSISLNSHKQYDNNTSSQTSAIKQKISNLSPELMVEHARARLCQRDLKSFEERSYLEHIIKTNGHPSKSEPSFTSIFSSLLDSDKTLVKNDSLNSTIKLDVNISSNIHKDLNQSDKDKVTKLSLQDNTYSLIDQTLNLQIPNKKEKIFPKKSIENLVVNIPISNPVLEIKKNQNNKLNIQESISKENVKSSDRISKKKGSLHVDANRPLSIIQQDVLTSKPLKSLIPTQKHELQSHYASYHMKIYHNNINNIVDLFVNNIDSDKYDLDNT